MEKCPYCGGSGNIILKENGEYVCTNCGSVLGVRYDEGYGDSPSMTRREYFAQFQPGTVKSGDLRARLQLLRLERDVERYDKESLVEYFISSLLPKSFRFLLSELKQTALQYVKDCDVYEIAFIVYAVMLNAGVPIVEKKLRDALKKITNGELSILALRRARKLAIELGLPLVLNRYACLVLICKVLGISHTQTARALQILNRVQGKPLATVVRALYETGIPLTKIAEALELPQTEIYKMLTNTRKTESHNSNNNDDGHQVTMLNHYHLLHGHLVTIGKVINLVVYDNGSNYLVFTRDIPPKNIKQIEVEIEELNLRLRLRKVKYKRKYVIGRRISGDIAEQLYRYYNTNGPIKARVVSWLRSESSQE